MKYIDTELEEGLSQFDIEHWTNNDIQDRYLNDFPEGYALVRSGRVKEGDKMWNWCDFWNGREVTKEEPDFYLHYIGSNGKGTPVGHWHCVARRIIS